MISASQALTQTKLIIEKKNQSITLDKSLKIIEAHIIESTNKSDTEVSVSFNTNRYGGFPKPLGNNKITDSIVFELRKLGYEVSLTWDKICISWATAHTPKSD